MRPFEYLEPTSIDEALLMLNQRKNEAKVMAGGTDLMPLMRDKIIVPKCIVDINRLSKLEFVRESENEIRIGALTRLRTIEASLLIQERLPVLAEAAERIGSIQVRNVATIGGNLVNASPAADMAPPLLVYEAAVRLRSKTGQREIPLSEFFVGVKKVAIGDDELLTDIIVPKPSHHTGGGFLKIGNRNALTISIASAAACVTLEKPKRCKVRIALGSVASTPVRARKAEALLEGQDITDRAIREASEQVIEEIDPISDLRASAEYRREISKVLVKRTLSKAVEMTLS